MNPSLSFPTTTIENISTENKVVDVALIHYVTRETIPGLAVKTDNNQNYVINNIPDGLYLARATYENDQRVMDPDRIAKFGEPEVEIVNGSTVSLQFDVTGSVELNAPTNDAASNYPVEITELKPTFKWNAYPSTTDYIIEVLDADGYMIWGGFNMASANPEKNIVIPSNQLTAVFNYDGKATIPELKVGNIYRWRIYASKSDKNSVTGWTLISASEDQKGLIKVVATN